MEGIATPDTMKVANELVALCREGKNVEALETLYSENIVSIEPCGCEQMPARMEGLEAVRGKTDWWYANNEVHSCEVDGPYVHGNQFIVLFAIDVTEKNSGNRMQMSEAGRYVVEDGKVVQEEFYFNPASMGNCEQSP